MKRCYEIREVLVKIFFIVATQLFVIDRDRTCPR